MLLREVHLWERLITKLSLKESMDLVHLAIHSLLLSSYLNHAILLFTKDTSNLAVLRDTPMQDPGYSWLLDTLDGGQSAISGLATHMPGAQHMCSLCSGADREKIVCRKMSAGWQSVAINPQEPWASSTRRARKWSPPTAFLQQIFKAFMKSQ